MRVKVQIVAENGVTIHERLMQFAEIPTVLREIANGFAPPPIFSDTRKAIITAMRNGATTPKEVIAATGIEQGTVNQRMTTMAKRGVIIRTAYGKYALKEGN